MKKVGFSSRALCTGSRVAYEKRTDKSALDYPSPNFEIPSSRQGGGRGHWFASARKACSLKHELRKFRLRGDLIQPNFRKTLGIRHYVQNNHPRRRWNFNQACYVKRAIIWNLQKTITRILWELAKRFPTPVGVCDLKKKTSFREISILYEKPGIRIKSESATTPLLFFTKKKKNTCNLFSNVYGRALNSRCSLLTIFPPARKDSQPGLLRRAATFEFNPCSQLTVNKIVTRDQSQT